MGSLHILSMPKCPFMAQPIGASTPSASCGYHDCFLRWPTDPPKTNADSTSFCGIYELLGLAASVNHTPHAPHAPTVTVEVLFRVDLPHFPFVSLPLLRASAPTAHSSALACRRCSPPVPLVSPHPVHMETFMPLRTSPKVADS